MIEQLDIIARYRIRGSARDGFSQHVKAGDRQHGWECVDTWPVDPAADVSIISTSPNAAPVATPARGGRKQTAFNERQVQS